MLLPNQNPLLNTLPWTPGFSFSPPASLLRLSSPKGHLRSRFPFLEIFCMYTVHTHRITVAGFSTQLSGVKA